MVETSFPAPLLVYEPGAPCPDLAALPATVLVQRDGESARELLRRIRERLPHLQASGSKMTAAILKLAPESPESAERTGERLELVCGLTELLEDPASRVYVLLDGATRSQSLHHFELLGWALAETSGRRRIELVFPQAAHLEKKTRSEPESGVFPRAHTERSAAVA